MLKCFPLKEVLSGGDPSHQEELGGLPGESYLCDRLRCSSDISGEIFLYIKLFLEEEIFPIYSNVDEMFFPLDVFLDEMFFPKNVF